MGKDYMIANEFINEEINPDILNPAFETSQEIDGLLYHAKTFIYPNQPQYLYITCFDKGEQVGYVKFYIHGEVDEKLTAALTNVIPSYRKRGVASTMYAYAKMLGNDVYPSRFQSDDGERMWMKWGRKGDAKHLIGRTNPNTDRSEHGDDFMELDPEWDEYASNRMNENSYQPPELSVGDKMLYSLTNMTDGGEGTTGRIDSNETRRKKSESRLGTSPSVKTRARISATLKGKPSYIRTEKTLAKLSENNWNTKQKGKSYEEKYGLDKAVSIREKQSITRLKYFKEHPKAKISRKFAHKITWIKKMANIYTVIFAMFDDGKRQCEVIKRLGIGPDTVRKARSEREEIPLMIKQYANR